MNRRNSYWLTIIVTAVVGILFILWHGRIDALSWIVVAMGILLAIPAVYNLIFAMVTTARQSDKPSGRTTNLSSVVASVCTLALGVWMMINPAFFVGLMAYLFAALLVAYGVYQILVTAYFSRPYSMPWFFYIVPVLLVAAGVVILCTSVRTMNSVVVLVTGILLVASAINWAMQRMTLYPIRKNAEIGATDNRR